MVFSLSGILYFSLKKKTNKKTTFDVFEMVYLYKTLRTGRRWHHRPGRSRIISPSHLYLHLKSHCGPFVEPQKIVTQSFKTDLKRQTSCKTSGRLHLLKPAAVNRAVKTSLQRSSCILSLVFSQIRVIVSTDEKRFKSFLLILNLTVLHQQKQRLSYGQGLNTVSRVS